MRWLALALVLVLTVGTVAGFTLGAGGSSPLHHGATKALATGTSASVYSCQGTGVVRPRNLVVTCADAGIQLTNTKWSQWSPNGAVGVTTYTVNFCRPSCVASKFSHFPNSKVSLSAPIATKHGKFFSLLTVRWVMAGRTHVFRFSYRGYLAFK